MHFFTSSRILFPVVFVAASFFPSCKKGSGDPQISLRSRKARLAGEWRLKSGDAGITVLEPGDPPFAQGFVFDGTKATATETSAGPPTIYIFAYLLNLKIEKDGTFVLTETYGSKTLIATGRWNFLSGVGELKNKEEVVFIIDKVQNDETIGHLFNKQTTEFTYKLLGLKNEELKLESGTVEYMSASGAEVTFKSNYHLIQ